MPNILGVETYFWERRKTQHFQFYPDICAKHLGWKHISMMCIKPSTCNSILIFVPNILGVETYFWDWFFQNKLTYFDLFYHFIMGKIGPKFSHLLTVRAEEADPPPPPLTVSLTVKYPFFFLTASLNPQCNGVFYLADMWRVKERPSL